MKTTCHNGDRNSSNWFLASASEILAGGFCPAVRCAGDNSKIAPAKKGETWQRSHVVCFPITRVLCISNIRDTREHSHYFTGINSVFKSSQNVLTGSMKPAVEVLPTCKDGITLHLHMHVLRLNLPATKMGPFEDDVSPEPTHNDSKYSSVADNHICCTATQIDYGHGLLKVRNRHEPFTCVRARLLA